MTEKIDPRAKAGTLPEGFRRIRLELAREPGHPQGSAAIGYVFFAPLDDDDHIDAEVWKDHRDACRVTRFRPGEADDVGHLVRKPGGREGGSWAFHYDVSGDEDDEAGYRFGDERFVIGEYVSVREDEGMRTFRVVSVEHAQ